MIMHWFMAYESALLAEVGLSMASCNRNELQFTKFSTVSSACANHTCTKLFKHITIWNNYNVNNIIKHIKFKWTNCTLFNFHHNSCVECSIAVKNNISIIMIELKDTTHYCHTVIKLYIHSNTNTQSVRQHCINIVFSS